MFPQQNHHQTTFVYGPDVYEKLIPEDHILYRIKNPLKSKTLERTQNFYNNLS
jgi:hypothetical protein